MPELVTQWMEDSPSEDALDAALTKLEQVSPVLASVVERRFFVGLTLKEIAAEDDISESTAKRQWGAARAWLAAEMQVG